MTYVNNDFKGVLYIPRPKKCRKVCHLPINDTFGPPDAQEDSTIFMTVEEYETIRLIDLQQYTQEECGQYMLIARTTVQSIYNSARQKLAQALVEGRTLRIHGGHYQLCSGNPSHCSRSGCCKHRPLQNNTPSQEIESEESPYETSPSC